MRGMRCLNCIPDTDGELFEAVNKGNLEQVRGLVRQRQPTDDGLATALPKYDRAKKNAIHLAVEEDRLDILDAILSSGFVRARDLIAPDTNGRTPLHYALERGNVPIAKYLIEKHISGPFLFSSATVDNISGMNQLLCAAYYKVPIFHLFHLLTEDKLTSLPESTCDKFISAFRETNQNNKNILHIVAEKCSVWDGATQQTQLYALRSCYRRRSLTISLGQKDDLGKTPFDYATENNPEYVQFLYVFSPVFRARQRLALAENLNTRLAKNSLAHGLPEEVIKKIVDCGLFVTPKPDSEPS